MGEITYRYSGDTLSETEPKLPQVGNQNVTNHAKIKCKGNSYEKLAQVRFWFSGF